MRSFVAALFLLLCLTPSTSGQKTRFGQGQPKPIAPSVNVRITASHIRDHCTDTFKGQSSCVNGLYADAILDGKKVELFGADKIGNRDTVLISPGNYQAQLTKDVHNADSTVIHQEYNILLRDGTAWHCIVSGISD